MVLENIKFGAGKSLIFMSSFLYEPWNSQLSPVLQAGTIVVWYLIVFSYFIIVYLIFSDLSKHIVTNYSHIEDLIDRGNANRYRAKGEVLSIFLMRNIVRK